MHTAGEILRASITELFSERLAFARASLRLFDLVLTKLDGRGGPYESVRGHLRLLREEKQAQGEWLAEKLRAQGGDAGEPPRESLTLKAEWAHLASALRSDAGPSMLFESLLLAEVYDTGGWEALLDVAIQAADEPLAEEVRQMLREEEEHLLFISRVVARYARSGQLDDTPMTVEAAPA